MGGCSGWAYVVRDLLETDGGNGLVSDLLVSSPGLAIDFSVSAFAENPPNSLLIPAFGLVEGGWFWWRWRAVVVVVVVLARTEGEGRVEVCCAYAISNIEFVVAEPARRGWN